MKEWLKMSFKIDIPANANTLIRLLQQSGYSAYIVGGCVRDSLLGRVPNDWDICTSATPGEMMKVFSDFQIIETGLQHGTLTIMVEGEQYEVTTFRLDGEYSDNRRPDSVTFTDKLVEDLSRRDFTINAMAYNDEDGLIDPFGGAEDLQKKLICCVGDASARFDEDALRILRALRFACQLGFVVEHSTYKAIMDRTFLLRNISKERINCELCKMAITDDFWTILLIYGKVFHQIIPGAYDVWRFIQHTPHHDKDVWSHTASTLHHCTSTDLITRLALLFHDFGKPRCCQIDENGIYHYKGHGKVSAEMADSIMLALKFDNKTRHAVTQLVYYHDATLEVDSANIKRWLNKIGVEQFKRLLDIRRADIKGSKDNYDVNRLIKVDKIEANLKAILEDRECFSLETLAINGNDLIALGWPAGKQIGQTLDELLQSVIDNKIANTREELLLTARLLSGTLHNSAS
jgi:tRNA nucleotidyltransferase (CCA-adding enzyme)